MPCNRSPGTGCYPSMHCRWYSSMPCSRSLGGGCSRGVCSSGVCSWGRGVVWPSGLVTFSLKVAFWLKVVFCYGLQVWPSGKAFWYWGVSPNRPFQSEGHTRMAFWYGLLLSPPSRWLLLRTVCILLECILAKKKINTCNISPYLETLTENYFTGCN